MWVFELTDRSGKMIHLSDERWKHILKHPEMRDKLILDLIKETILDADKTILDMYDHGVHVYFKYYKDRKQFLFVSVKYLNGEGYIITSFYTDKAQ